MIRGVYTAVRAPIWSSHEAFIRRWRLHGGRSMAAEQFWSPIAHYVHGDAVLDSDAFPGAAQDIDGVGDIWWQDEVAYARTRDAADAPEVWADGAQTLDQARSRYIIGRDVAIRPRDVPATIGVWLFHIFDAAEGPSDWSTALIDEIERMPADTIHVGKAINSEWQYDLYMELGFDDLKAASAAFRSVTDLTDPRTNITGFPTQLTIVPVWRHILYDKGRCLGAGKTH